MTATNIVLLLLGALAVLTGLLKKTEDADGRAWWKRVTVAGWSFVALVLIQLGLNVYKEVHSLEGRIRGTYPQFISTVEDVTGYSHDDWTRYFSYRITLRLLLQETYLRAFRDRAVPGETIDMLSRKGALPEGMREMLRDLGKAGVIDDALCKRLDFLRHNTYSTEWGALANGRPSEETLKLLRDDAELALGQLAYRAQTIRATELRPNLSTGCGTDP